jgi:hypothetical protein
VTRDRDPGAADRRAVAVRALRDRNAEAFRLYAGMNSSMDRICAGYTDTELELLADFRRRRAPSPGIPPGVYSRHDCGRG